MKEFALQHPTAFGIGLLFYVVMSFAHVLPAFAYLERNKRATFEQLALLLCMALLWWLFSVGMMMRGYDDFWEKNIRNKGE